MLLHLFLFVKPVVNCVVIKSFVAIFVVIKSIVVISVVMFHIG